jgi:hypothetical protein
MLCHAGRVDRHVHDPRAHRREVVGAEELGHRRGVGAAAAVYR